jgi:SAM-dependent methyltransferase
MRKLLRKIINRRFRKSGSSQDVVTERYHLDAMNLSMISDKVDYSLKVGENYLNLLRKHLIDPKGKSILELGPGSDFGAMIFLSCLGAHVSVLDVVLAPWVDEYHSTFYELLKDRIVQLHPECNVAVIEKLAVSGEYSDDIIALFQTPIGDAVIPDGSFDIVFSNAVLEHVPDISLAFSVLQRISRVGGWGFHQVDLRDHRDFTRPLEFLLLHDDVWTLNDIFHSGNRMRLCQMLDMFSGHNFQVVEADCNMVAENEYVENFLARIKNSDSKFKDFSAEELKKISALLTVKKK